PPARRPGLPLPISSSSAPPAPWPRHSCLSTMPSNCGPRASASSLWLAEAPPAASRRARMVDQGSPRAVSIACTFAALVAMGRSLFGPAPTVDVERAPGRVPGALVTSGCSAAPNRSVDLQFAHLVPALAVDLARDDLRRRGQMRTHGFEPGGEVVALDVRFRAFVGECLDEDVLVRILQALRPFEEEVAGFCAGRLGEGAHRLGELVDAVGLHVVFDNDEDHDGFSSVGSRMGSVPA